MTMNTVTGKQTAALTSQAREIFMSSCILGETLSFLAPEGLRTAETVCHSWRNCITTANQWKKQCQSMLGLPSDTDPKEYLPEGFSYKKSVEIISPRLLGRSVWQRYIGDVGRVSPIPKAISFKKWNDPDPCDSTTTIGKEYVWIYCPSHIEVQLEGFSLSQPDDPASEAPQIIEKVGSTVGKVPVTINNIVKLFERPKTGHPSKYSYIWDKIIEQHGNKRISAGWRCMRWNVIGRNLSVAEQRTLAKGHRVVFAQLADRIVFNFLTHARSNVYPDGQDPYIYARTSTLTHDDEGEDWLSGCGAGGPSGLYVDVNIFDDVDVGVCVVLPADVQAIGP